MKLYVFILAMILSGTNVLAQDLPGLGTHRDTKKRNPEFGGRVYVTLDLKVPVYADEISLEFGGGLGTMLSNNIGLGGAFNTLITHNIDLPLEQDSKPFLRMSYGGLEAAWKNKIGEEFHLSGKLLLGLAHLSYSESHFADALADPSGSWCYISEINLRGYYKLYDNLWIGLGYGYRLPFGVDYAGFSDSDLRGSVFSLAVKFL